MITLSGIKKMVSGRELYQSAGLQIYPGEKIGLVGPNGAGKTTLFRLITGEIAADEGTVSIQNGIRIAYFSQSLGEMQGDSALEAVIGADEKLSDLSRRLAKYEEQLCDPLLTAENMEAVLEHMGNDQTMFEKLDGYTVETRAREVLTGLGIAPRDHQQPLENFSSGWKMRIALAKVLILVPDLILMDEPTNYLDLETILWLEQWLMSFKGAFLLTTHDREFMNRVATKIIEVAAGKITTFSGNYDFYEREREIHRRNNMTEFNRQQSMLKKEEQFIARFAARASHAAQVQSRVKMLAKIERVERTTDEDAIKIVLPEIPRGGNDVVVIKNLGKRWQRTDGSDNPVFSGLSATVHVHDRVAVMGCNGAGKSTFLKIICNLAQPTEGEAVVGPSISIGYFGQLTIETLTPGNTVLEELQRKLPHLREANLRNLLAGFLFRGDDVHKKVRVLSGGEKARMILASLLSQPHNCLILDEPTNHLDITSREVLLDALRQYSGTMLLVSHDRYFLRAIANRVFEVGHGTISVYEGNYDYYLENR